MLIYILNPTFGFAQKSEDVFIIINGDTLYGTFTNIGNKRAPVALLIAGSGPTDRNCNQGKSLQTNAFKYLAEELARNGISSLRYDKRGIAQSKNAGKREEDMRFDDMVADASAWIDFLKSKKSFGAYGIIGHSEGSLIGMLVAKQTNIDFYISVAGAGMRADTLLKQQLSKQPAFIYNYMAPRIDSLAKGLFVKNVDPYAMALLRPSVQPYMISWLKYDPAKELSGYNGNTLLLQGTSDLQVDSLQAVLLKKGQPQAELCFIKDMNHVLKKVNGKEENMKSYNQPEIPLHEGLVPSITGFLSKKNLLQK